jgi:hypothetical protein
MRRRRPSRAYGHWRTSPSNTKHRRKRFDKRAKKHHDSLSFGKAGACSARLCKMSLAARARPYLAGCVVLVGDRPILERIVLHGVYDRKYRTGHTILRLRTISKPLRAAKTLFQTQAPLLAQRALFLPPLPWAEELVSTTANEAISKQAPGMVSSSRRGLDIPQRSDADYATNLGAP